MSEKSGQLNLPLGLEDTSNDTAGIAKISLDDCQRMQAFCLLAYYLLIIIFIP